MFIAVLVLLAGSVAAQADDALLEVLRHNKLITDDQYQVLQKARAEKEKTAVDRSLPAQDHDLLDVLLANGLISQAQFADLRVKVGAAKKIEQEAQPSLTEGFKVTSQDKSFQAQAGVYFQMDTALYNDDLTDFSSGTELRRGRIFLAGTVLSDWDYKFEADFGGTTQGGSTNSVTVTDAYVRYTGLRPYAFTVGNFKIPFSLESVGSAKYLTFMERGLPFALTTTRRLGGMAAVNGDNWTASVGLFGDTVTTQNNDDEGMEAVGRVTHAPFFQSDRVLHLGASGGWVHPQQTAANGLETVRFRSKPETNIMSDGLTESATLSSPAGTFGRSSGRLVDTGNIPGDVNYFTLFGGELAGIYGPFSVQSEYIRADVDRETGGDPGFDGYYGYASWFLTGESRNYKADKGVFDILTPLRSFSLDTGGWGAWEVAVRYSNLDLNDEGVQGVRSTISALRSTGTRTPMCGSWPTTSLCWTSTAVPTTETTQISSSSAPRWFTELHRHASPGSSANNHRRRGSNKGTSGELNGWVRVGSIQMLVANPGKTTAAASRRVCGDPTARCNRRM